MKFVQRRESNTVFPAPEPEERVALNPPSLQWVPEPGAELYRVTVKDAAGKIVAARETAANFLRFSEPFAPGRYTWNVHTDGAERGEWAFTVPEDAIPFLPPAAR